MKQPHTDNNNLSYPKQLITYSKQVNQNNDKSTNIKQILNIQKQRLQNTFKRIKHTSTISLHKGTTPTEDECTNYRQPT